MIRSEFIELRLNVPDVRLARRMHTPPEALDDASIAQVIRTAQAWFAQHARPWRMLHEVPITEVQADKVRLPGDVCLSSSALASQLSAAHSLVVVALSAGAEVDREVQRLWQCERYDEAFALDALATEALECARRSCVQELGQTAKREGLHALDHYSPGYDGWPLDDQLTLHRLLSSIAPERLRSRLHVLPSGMLTPKKSTLAVVGLSKAKVERQKPCSRCSQPNCSTRRNPYEPKDAQFSSQGVAQSTQDPAPNPSPASERSWPYAFPRRALSRWSRERLSVQPQPDGRILASFRFDGTTCSNMGAALAVDFTVELEPEQHPPGLKIRAMRANPAPDDQGCRLMCAALSAPETFLASVSSRAPLVGQRLDAVLDWQASFASSGCLCSRANQNHKWRLVLNTVLFALSANHPEASRPEQASANSPIPA